MTVGHCNYFEDAKLRILVAVLITLLVASSSNLAWAQTSENRNNPRKDYSEARVEMDALIMKRQMSAAISMFENVIVLSDDNLAEIDAKIEATYPVNFENVALVRSTVHKNGFRQELIAYWTGASYLYVYLLLHTDANTMKLLHFDFDSNFHALNLLF